MKFDAIVGNPPYQELDGGNNASAMPVYQHFVNAARLIKPIYISMIMPSRWCVSGRGLDAFRESMLTDIHFSKMFDFRNGGDCFPGIRIGGGVCYILWDSKYEDGKIEIANMPRNKSSQLRPKKEFGLDFLIRDNIVRSIIYKVFAFDEPKMSSLSFSQKPFGFRTNFMGYKDIGEIKIYTKKERVGFGYVSREEVTKNAEFIDEWQVVTSRSTSVPEEDNGQVLREVQTFISEPGSVVTESYVVVASFKQEQFARNCLSYLKTKFFRILCQVTIVSPDVSARTFDLVPIQDFSRPWADDDLYKKYGLEDDEITFIESNIKSMK
jgi:site-specific DNA-methyltransferase (adenine-specific)